MLAFLRSLLRLPSPSELGWAQDDALMLREFTPYQEGRSWEDWHEHCRTHYPVRYLAGEAIPRQINRWFVWPAKRLFNGILDYCLPSRRHHLFDLRNIDPLSEYKHGYLDPCEVFWLAGWGALLRWNDEAGARNARASLTPEEQASPDWLPQLQSYDELKSLVHYWTVTRVEREMCNKQLYNAAIAIKTTLENRSLYEAAQEKWLSHCWETERLEEDMWLRLAKMRSHLWA